MTLTDIIYFLLLIYALLCIFGKTLVPKYLSKRERICLLISIGFSGAAINSFLGGMKQTFIWSLMTIYWAYQMLKENRNQK